MERVPYDPAVQGADGEDGWDAEQSAPVADEVTEVAEAVAEDEEPATEEPDSE